LSKQMKKAALAAVAALAIGWGSPAMAQEAPGSNGHGHGPHGHASNIKIPLTATGGIAASNQGPTCSQSDTVELSNKGHLHILAQPQRNVVRLNAADVSGTGSFGDYDIDGSHEADLGGNTIPSDGTLAATAQFQLSPEDGSCASQPLTVKLNLVFSGGELQSSSTACVAGTTGC
jgi:hypothetical protein